MILTVIISWAKSLAHMSLAQSCQAHTGQLRAAYRHVQMTGAARRRFRQDLDVLRQIHRMQSGRGDETLLRSPLPVGER